MTYNSKLIQAVKLRRAKLVNELLRESNRHDVNKALKEAASLGYTEIINLILRHSEVQPQVNNNAAIRTAAENGHTKAVWRLLQDARVDPADEDNEAIRDAAAAGHTKTVEILLKEPRVDPAALDNDAIILAASMGHYSTVAILLKDARVNPADDDNEAIKESVKHGHVKVVKLLLTDSRVDPAAENHQALRTAVMKKSYKEIIQILLYDPRTWIHPPDVTAPKFAALRCMLEVQLEAAAAAIHAFRQRWRGGIASSWMYDPALKKLVEQYLPIELYRLLEHRLRTGVYAPALLDSWIRRIKPPA